MKFVTIAKSIFIFGLTTQGRSVRNYYVTKYYMSQSHDQVI